jgi:tetratricopeptide (TPR) repeat protein
MVEPRVSDGTDSSLDQDDITLPVGDGSPDEPVTLGHFRLGGHLGSGGMGSVFEAHDTALGRRVAIKLLRPGASGEKGRARLLREAQALARLKHPNIVTVFEVGVAGEEVFIAMELVAGGTLREWMGKPRNWRETTDLFLALGRGLAAAHALGLVHRDVKPSNIFLDLDGTPKLGDFGLVSPSGASEKADSGEHHSISATGLTTAGKVMGTPAYMSPEQFGGQPADARADQYAFCATFHEALTGKRPNRDGAGRPIPQRLRRILDRGLNLDAAARYPAMDALLKDLARVRRGRARLWLALAGIAAVAAVATSSWTAARVRDPCPPPAARLETVWGAAKRASLRDHLMSVDHDQGATRFAAISAFFDSFAAGLRDQSVEACRATRIRGAQSDRLLDLRMRCLDRRFGEFAETVSILGGVQSVQTLDRAVAGSAQLTPLAGCADVVALEQTTQLPEKPEARAKAEALGLRIQQVTVRERAGDLKDLPKAAQALVDDARTLNHPPTLTSALMALAQVQMAVGENAAAAGTLREMAQSAASAHDDRAQAFAWTKLIKITGWDLLKPEQALALVPAANAAVARSGDAPDLRADVLFAHADVLAAGSGGREALRLYEAARVLLEDAGAKTAGSPLGPVLAEVGLSKGDAHGALGENQTAIAEFGHAIEAFRQLYGPESAREAFAWHNLGEAQRSDGKLEAALESYRHAARIREQRLGDSKFLAGDLQGVAASLADLKRWDEALAANDHALQIAHSQPGTGAITMMMMMIDRARVLVHLGRQEEGLHGYDEAIALMDRDHLTTVNFAITVYNRAELQMQLRHLRDALNGYARAVKLFEETRGKEHGILVYPLVGQGHCLILAGHPAEAIPVLQRALALKPLGSAGSVVAQGRFYLARARVESGRDRARGLKEARAARAAAAAAGTDKEILDEMDRWLLAHG